MARPPGAVDANAAGGTVRRRGGAVLHVVAQQVKPGAEAGEIVQPEEAGAQPGRRDDVGGLVGGVPQQAVDGETAPAGRDAGHGLAQHRGHRLRREHPQRLAVQQHAQMARLALRPHHRPGPRRKDVQMVASERGDPRALPLQAQLHAAGVGRVVVVAEGDVQVGKSGPPAGQRLGQHRRGSRLDPRRGPGRGRHPGVQRNQPLDDLVAETEVGPCDAALHPPDAEEMDEGVDVVGGDVGIGFQVVLHREARARVARLAPADLQEMIERIEPRFGHVGVAGQVEGHIEFARRQRAVAQPRLGRERQIGRALVGGDQRLEAPGGLAAAARLAQQVVLGPFRADHLAALAAADGQIVMQRVPAGLGYLWIGRHIAARGEPGRRIAPFPPADLGIVVDRIDGDEVEVRVDRPVEGPVERGGDRPIHLGNWGLGGHAA